MALVIWNVSESTNTTSLALAEFVGVALGDLSETRHSAARTYVHGASSVHRAALWRVWADGGEDGFPLDVDTWKAFWWYKSDETDANWIYFAFITRIWSIAAIYNCDIMPLKA